MLHNVNNNQV